MATGARSAGLGDRDRRLDDNERTPAQWFCLIIGPTLILVGLLGFLVDPRFDTQDGSAPFNGDSLLGVLEVNGWHNLVHIASGVFLLAMAKRHAAARSAALIFAAIYAVVTVIGFIDGQDVLGFMPVNTMDNILHLVFALAGLLAGLAPAGRDRDEVARRGAVVGETRSTQRGQTTHV